MAGRSAYHLVDRLLEGKLADFLTDHRRNGESFETIARELDKQFDIGVSSHAVRRWIHQLEATAAAS